MTGTVSPAARMLGFAGLLPQIAAVVAIAAGYSVAALVAAIYAAAILSFLGGIWWGVAMRRTQGQAGLAALAVVPSLVAVALVTGALVLTVGGNPFDLRMAALRWTLVALGCAVMLTLPVDRHLVRTGEAPAGWMALRVPLSLGLGALTIAAGVLLATA